MDMAVDPDWLKGHGNVADCVVLDASLHLPASGRDAASEFRAGHIPGARFLDLATLRDPTGSAPNTVPTAEQFARRLRMLGVERDQKVVLYDDSPLKSSVRAWFLFRMFGWQDVAILDGGLAAWREAGGALQTGMPDIEASKLQPSDLTIERYLLRTKQDMLANLDSKAEQVVDARDAKRFSGETADMVHDLPGGHIPGARNLPFTSLFDDRGCLRSNDDLSRIFAASGMTGDKPVIASCGSGITASVLLFALMRTGRQDWALYDGSWSEWGGDPATPKEQGQAE